MSNRYQYFLALTSFLLSGKLRPDNKSTHKEILCIQLDTFISHALSVNHVMGYKTLLFFLCVGISFFSGPTRASASEHEAKAEILIISEGQFLASRSVLPPDFSSIETQPVTLPDVWEKSRHKSGNSGWYRFEIRNNPPSGVVWAVFLPKLNMNAAVYFNGHFLGDGGSFKEPLGRNWNRPLLFSISPEAWVSGENILLIRLAGYPVNIKLAPIQVGPLPLLRQSYEIRTLFQNRIIAALFPVTVTVATFTFALWLRRRKETVYLWFALSVFSWALSSLNLFVRDIPLSLRAWEVLAHASFLWWNYFQALFALRFIQYRRPRLERCFLFQAMVGTLLMVFAPLEEMGEISQIWSVAGLLIGGYYTTLTLRQWLSKKQKEAGVLGVSMLLIWLTCLHDWFYFANYFPLTNQTALFINHYAAPFIFLFMAWHITGRFIIALDEADRLNRDLESRIGEARQALEAGHQKILKMEKKTVLVAERSRISREIHDGLGANFSNAITLVDLIERESGGRSAQRRLTDLKTILSEGFTELRNLIIAMEGEVSTLETLSSLMEEKTRKVADLTSLDCDTVIDIGDGTQPIPQRLSLNLLRVLQEGLTNIVKHAQASRIDLCIALRSGKLFFELRDDGRGFITKGAPTGYGVRNMNRRCHEMGTQLTIHSKPGDGTRLSLRFSLNPALEKTI